MFGQRNNNDDKAGAPAVPPVGTLNTSNGIPDDHAVTQMLSDADAPALSAPVAAPNNTFMPFGGQPTHQGPYPVQAPAPPMPSTPMPSTPMPTYASPTTHASTADISDMSTEDLVRMKQDALQHLQPLVGTLQQNPEEEFRTLMMMIQATDDRSLLKKALDAAKKIGDDKIRAQAMLDVINEINYFTQVEQQ